MDLHNRKQNWASKQLVEYESNQEKGKRLTSGDPTIFVKDPDTNKYEPWGIRNYKYVDPSFILREKTSDWCTESCGTLELPFPGGKRICIDNVSTVIITWGKKHIEWGVDQSTTLHVGLCGIAPDLVEMEELHFAVKTISFDPKTLKKKSNALFYEGSTLVEKIEGIEDLHNFHRGQVYYCIKTKKCFVHHIRDFSGNDYVVGKGKHTKLGCDFQRSRKLRKITQNCVEKAVQQGYYDFYFFSNSSTSERVLESYITRHYTPQFVDNWFLDDETTNYYVRIDINDLMLLSFLAYYGNSCFGIYSIPIDAYLPYLPYESESEWFYKDVEAMQFHKKVLDDALCVSTYKNGYELMAALESIRDRSYTVQQQVIIELLHRLEPGAIKNRNGQYVVRGSSDMAWSRDTREDARRRYFAEKQFMIDNSKLDVVWKGEYEMYLLAKKLYSDAIYQYHCEWLGRQSLDVYIPSISLGIEYQGIQHYEAIAHFGGEEAFIRRVELDAQKRNLCAANNVDLLEWKYSSPLTKNALAKQINRLVAKKSK